MNEKIKLILALMQVNNILSLIEENEYESFIANKLIGVQVELQRQLTNCIQSSKMKEQTTN